MRIEHETFGLLDVHGIRPTFVFALSNPLSYVTMPNITYHTNLSVLNLHLLCIYYVTSGLWDQNAGWELFVEKVKGDQLSNADGQAEQNIRG